MQAVFVSLALAIVCSAALGPMEIIKHVNRLPDAWNASITPFTFLSNEDKLQLLGTKHSVAAASSIFDEDPIDTSIELPKEFFYGEKWPECVS
jgi:hypothetical protein